MAVKEIIVKKYVVRLSDDERQQLGTLRLSLAFCGKRNSPPLETQVPAIHSDFGRRRSEKEQERHDDNDCQNTIN